MNNTTQYGNDLTGEETRQRPWGAIVVSWLRGASSVWCQSLKPVAFTMVLWVKLHPAHRDKGDFPHTLLASVPALSFPTHCVQGPQHHVPRQRGEMDSTYRKWQLNLSGLG